MKINDEMRNVLDCAVNVQKHLVRLLEEKQDPQLQEKLNYVNSVISEVNEMQVELQSVA